MQKRIRVTRDLGGVEGRTKQMTKLGQYAFVNQVMADSNPYVPMLTGDMRNQTSIGLGGQSIIYNAPYSRKQYYNYGAKFTTPGTGPKWDSKAMAIHGGTWADIIKKAMK